MGRSFKQCYDVAAYQYDNQLPNFEQDEVSEEDPEEVPKEENLKAIDYSNCRFYEHLELLLTGFRSRYKSTWELYLNDYNPNFPRLSDEISAWRRGKLIAYRKSISEIINIMKIYKEVHHGTS